MAISPKRVKSPAKFLLAVYLLLLAACVPAVQAVPTLQITLSPSSTPLISPSATSFVPPAGSLEYLAQSGDTLDVVAIHFGVNPSQVVSDQPIPPQGLLDPGQKLYLPPFHEQTTPHDIRFPDSEVVYSPSAKDFDLLAYVKNVDGKLKNYIDTFTFHSGAEVLLDWAVEFSINPRLLLTLLEWNGHWVTGNPETRDQAIYAFGFVKNSKGGLYDQTAWVCQQLNNGYYGWRSGTLTELSFPDGSKLRLAPDLNAGTVALMYYLSQFKNQAELKDSLVAIIGIHEKLFGDFTARAAAVEPLLPAGLKQPQLSLPFPANATWNYTCGPHTSWGNEGTLPLGALDFAPPSAQSGCGNSVHWVTAMADGTILQRPVLTAGLVVQELDHDNNESTGWVLYYMHIAGTGRVQPGEMVKTGDRIGHPSCEGGSSTGAHVHVMRKYNGEWIPAVGGLPFVLSGFQAGLCEQRCEGGTLTRGDVTVKSYPWGNYWTKICQPGSDRCTMGTPTPRPTLTPTITRTPPVTPSPFITPTGER